MRFGYFDDKNMEYVIDRADTPRPWSNYLGSTSYGGIITNHAGGYSFYNSAKEGRFIRFRPNSVPLDQPGRYFYIKDKDLDDFWSASWQPTGKPLDQYKSVCRHGTGYTIIESEYKDIRSESTYFVPLDKNLECWILSLENRSDRSRKLSVFTYCEFANQWNTDQDLINLQYSQFIVNASINDDVIDIGIHDKMSYNENSIINGGSFHSFMTVAGAKLSGYDTVREEAIGVYGSYKSPKSVVEGKCRNTLAYGDNACGMLQIDIELKPGEKNEFMVLLGVGRGTVEGKKALKELPSAEHAKQELKKLKEFWHGMIGNFQVESPDANFNSMINMWAAYNCLITFTWSRSASFIYQGERNGLGFRDSVQDLMGTMCNITELSKKRLELMLTGQCSTGGALHVVKPYDHRPGEMEPPKRYRSDDCLWFFNAVPEYVKETGDIGFYDKVLPYADCGKATVLEHLRKALEFNLQRTGANGIPVGLLADWNDCLNLGDKGETFFVAMQVIYGLKTYKEICTFLENADEARWASQQELLLSDKIQNIGWDGKWFIRAIRGNGNIIGTSKDYEASIFLNTQSWAVISGTATEDQASIAMESVYEKLYTKNGLIICAPPFKTKDPSEISAMVFLDGVKENGGIFSHTQGWAVIAEAILGHGNRAFEYLKNSLPSSYNDSAEIRQIEPYVYSQHTLSKFSRHEGASRVPWLTGAAAWSYYSATQYILGIRPEYDGIMIDPCIPSNWKSLKIRRIFRGKTLLITIDNSSGVQKGVSMITCNSDKIEGRIVPFSKLSGTNNINVKMGLAEESDTFCANERDTVRL